MVEATERMVLEKMVLEKVEQTNGRLSPDRIVEELAESGAPFSTAVLLEVVWNLLAERTLEFTNGWRVRVATDER
jgi:hypothetical protein